MLGIQKLSISMLKQSLQLEEGKSFALVFFVAQISILERDQVFVYIKRNLYIFKDFSLIISVGTQI